MANAQPSQNAGKDSAGKFPGQPQDMQPDQIDQPMQSAPALSHASDDDTEEGRFSIAEEQNFDQQSEQARRIGQMPSDEGIGPSSVKPSDAIAQSADASPAASSDGSLQKSMDRAVPKSD